MGNLTLFGALGMAAFQLDLKPEELWDYANEDKLKGYYDGGGEFAIPFAADGQFLYALIRALKPRYILELGTNQGGSARHILEALAKNDQESFERTGMGYVGLLACVDNDPNSALKGIPSELLHYAHNIVHKDAEEWINEFIAHAPYTSPRFTFDFIHEDASHSAHLVNMVYSHLSDLMPKGGVILSHDVGTGVAHDIMQGITNAGFTMPPTYIYEGSPCGFSVMKYEGVEEK